MADESSSRCVKLCYRSWSCIDDRAQIGQIFRHRHYGYLAVIHGHDATCTASLEWQRAMRLEDLDQGSRQPFYNTSANDGSTRYVAEENIDICDSVTVDEIQDLIDEQPNLGKYFSDYLDGRFVPSADLMQQYPEG